MENLLRLCNSCKYYNEELNSCKAFPDGIELDSDEPHFDVLPNQTGETVYDMDPDKYDEFEMYRRVHPEIRFPIIVSYDIPDEGESVTQAEVQG